MFLLFWVIFLFFLSLSFVLSGFSGLGVGLLLVYDFYEDLFLVFVGLEVAA